MIENTASHKIKLVFKISKAKNEILKCLKLDVACKNILLLVE